MVSELSVPHFVLVIMAMIHPVRVADLVPPIHAKAGMLHKF